MSVQDCAAMGRKPVEFTYVCVCECVCGWKWLGQDSGLLTIRKKEVSDK